MSSWCCSFDQTVSAAALQAVVDALLPGDAAKSVVYRDPNQTTGYPREAFSRYTEIEALAIAFLAREAKTNDAVTLGTRSPVFPGWTGHAGGSRAR